MGRDSSLVKWVAILLGLFCLPGYAKKPQKQPTPLWSFDVRQFRWEDPADKIPEAFSKWLYEKGVVFTDRELVAAYFVIRQAPALSVPGHPQASDSFQLRGVFLDAATGDLRHKQDWPTMPYLPSELLPTHDGKFVIRAGHSLTLYSPTFDLMKERSLPWSKIPERPYPTLWVSPTGRTLFLSDDRFPKLNWVRLDSDSLDVLDEWNEEYDSTLCFTVSDNAIARSCDSGQVWLRTVGEPWRLHYSSPTRLLCDFPTFIDNETLAIDVCPGIVVVSTRGDVLFEDLFPDEYRKDPLRKEVVISRESRRFAIVLKRLKGGYFDTPFHVGAIQITIYDLRTKNRIFTLEFKRPPKHAFWDFALSPDGQRLAVMLGPRVEVYQLPSGPQQ